MNKTKSAVAMPPWEALRWASLNMGFSMVVGIFLVLGLDVHFSAWVGNAMFVFGNMASVVIYTALGFLLWPVVAAAVQCFCEPEA